MRLVVLAGEPGTGKTTLLRRVMSLAGAKPDRPLSAGLILYHDFPEIPLSVIGDYSSRQGFPGSDKLSMAVPPQIPDFLSAMQTYWKDYAVMWEGDRLTGSSLLEDLRRRFAMSLYVVQCSSEEILEKRRYLRGDRQSSRFKAGRRSKALNLLSSAVPIVNDTEEDLERAAQMLADGLVARK